jgi:hypothetical protein
MANPVGALKAIDGLLAQERCQRGLGTTQTDHEREQIRDIMGRITSPTGLEPEHAHRTQVSTATPSGTGDTRKLRHAKRTARLGNVQSGNRRQLRAISMSLRVDDVPREIVCQRSSEHPAKQGVDRLASELTESHANPSTSLLVGCHLREIGAGRRRQLGGGRNATDRLAVCD